MLCVFRLAGQTASRAVSLFLDGDVSFLPDNSFPSHLQLLKVGRLLPYNYTFIKYWLKCFSLFQVLENYGFFLSAARGFLETVPVGLSAHGMCVRVTSQCESQNEASIESSVVLCCRRCDLRFVRCCPGGGAPDWPTAITVGGDELHMQPPAVLLLSRKVLCWAC